MTTLVQVEGWVLDYACKHHHHEVIAALLKRHGENLDKLDVFDVRLCAATLHRIVYCREVGELETAIQIVEQLYDVIQDGCPLRVYFRLVYGLKMKVLLDQLQSGAFPQHTLNARLNQYFPRGGTLSFDTTARELERLQGMVSNFRKFFLSLVINMNQREIYLREDYPTEFGPSFMASLEKHTSRFLDVVESCLPEPIIDKMMQKGTAAISQNVPSLSTLFDVLLECLVNKTSLESRDLLDILTWLDPISCQDNLRPRLQLTFGSDDSSLSYESHLDTSVGSKPSSSRMSEVGACSHHGNSGSSEGALTVLSGESVSIISKKKPACNPVKAESIGLAPRLTEKEEAESQVYMISSSSESAPSQALEDKKDYICETSHSDKGDVSCAGADTSDSEQHISSCVVQSSHLEESDLSSSITYPELGRHQKEPGSRLCVVKLFRNQGLDVTVEESEVKLYS